MPARTIQYRITLWGIQELEARRSKDSKGRFLKKPKFDTAGPPLPFRDRVRIYQEK